MLRSSSRSGQWRPWPSPINSQLLRSFTVPFSRRGYHTKGLDTARPSDNSTVMVEEPIFTFSTQRSRSGVKVFMPRFEEFGFVGLDDGLDGQKLGRAKSSATVKSHRFDPELRGIIVALHVDMRRLRAVVGVKVEPIRPDSQDGWRAVRITRLRLEAISARRAAKCPRNAVSRPISADILQSRRGRLGQRYCGPQFPQFIHLWPVFRCRHPTYTNHLV